MYIGIHINTRDRWFFLLAIIILSIPLTAARAHSLVFRVMAGDAQATSIAFNYSDAARQYLTYAEYQTYSPAKSDNGIQGNKPQAINVVFDYSGAAKAPPAHSEYRVYAPDETEDTYQSGQTDRMGRVSFLPDRAGKWRVEMRDEEGHEIVAPIDVTQEMVVEPTPRWGRWLFLASIIINLTLILFILQFRQEKKQAQSVKSKGLTCTR